MIITKFGGSSLAGPVEFINVIQIIKSRLDKSPLAVVSASGKTTDLLLKACALSQEGSLQKALSILEDLEFRHIFISKQVINSLAASRNIENVITGYFTELKSILTCVSLTELLSPNITAKALSYGELLSSHILNAALNDAGISSVFADSRDFIITDDNYLNAKPLYIETGIKAFALKKQLENNTVPVIQGFIGKTAGGVTTTLGRNGSDFTASLVGAALEVKEIEIWTDVNGILTADPKRIPGAETVREISYSEAEELAYYGGEVLHPKTIYPARESNIPIRILNTNDISDEGTVVKDNSFPSGRGITTVTYKEKITVLSIYLKEKFYAHDNLRKILGVLEKYNITFSLMSSSQLYVSFVLESNKNGNENCMEAVNELAELSDAETDESKSLVCLIGESIKEPEASAKVLKFIGKYKPEAVFHNPSLINLSFIIGRNRLDEVLQGLHRELLERAEKYNVGGNIYSRLQNA